MILKYYSVLTQLKASIRFKLHFMLFQLGVKNMETGSQLWEMCNTQNLIKPTKHCQLHGHHKLSYWWPPTSTSDSTKRLVLTTRLSWANHYNGICSKAYYSLYLIRRTIISPQTPLSTKKLLYLTLVISHFSYCSQVWHPILLRDVTHLERIQRKATKYILQNPNINYKDRLIQLNLLPLMYWLELQDIMFL